MKLYNTAEEYLKDPETMVFVKHNDEAGVWQYSVVVAESRDFWLDSFETEQNAIDFIYKNNLMIADKL